MIEYILGFLTTPVICAIGLLVLVSTEKIVNRKKAN